MAVKARGDNAGGIVGYIGAENDLPYSLGIRSILQGLAHADIIQRLLGHVERQVTPCAYGVLVNNCILAVRYALVILVGNYPVYVASAGFKVYGPGGRLYNVLEYYVLYLGGLSPVIVKAF